MTNRAVIDRTGRCTARAIPVPNNSLCGSITSDFLGAVDIAMTGVGGRNTLIEKMVLLTLVTRAA